MNRPGRNLKYLFACLAMLCILSCGCQGESGPIGGSSGDNNTNNPLLDPFALPQGPAESNEDPPPTNPPAPPGPPPIEVSLPDQKHYVLTNRQKFVGLPGYIPGVEYDNVAFAIVQPPTNGVLLGTAPNVAYVPNTDFVGEDSFEYTATGGGYALRRRMVLKVDPNYVLPIGIPAPEFGLTESHMMYVGQTFDFGNGPEFYRDAGNGPYTHYVDFNRGNNTNNPFGTEAQPRKTIPSNLPAGSVVELHGDGFNSTLWSIITSDATAQKPVFIRGSNALNKAIFRRPIWVETDYVIIENIDFDCREMTGNVNGSNWIKINETLDPALRTYHHIAIRHCLFRDQPTRNTNGLAAISARVLSQSELANTSTDLIEHVVIYDVEVRNFSQWDDFNGIEDYGAITFHANTRYGWVLDSHLHHIRGDAFALSRTGGLSNQVPPHYIYFGRNYAHNLKENGIDYKLARHSVFSQNTVHTVRVSDSSNGDAVLIQSTDTNDTWQSCDNIWIIFNEIYDAERGIFHATSGTPGLGFQSRSYLVGNIIHDIRAIRGNPDQRGIGIAKLQLAQSRIIGNTIYNCEHGMWLGMSNSPYHALSAAVVRNNIITELSERYFNDTGTHGLHILLRPHGAVAFSEMDHNLHWEDIGLVRIGIVSSMGSLISYASASALQAAYPLFGGGNVDLPPLMRNPGFGDFYLTSGSPCLGAGADDDVYTLFPTLFGRSIEFYQDETPITQGQINIGALPLTP